MSDRQHSTLLDSIAPAAAEPTWTARVVALAGRALDLPPFEVDASRVRVGRDPASTLVLDDPRVSREHAELHLARDGTLELVRVGRAPLRVNGATVERATIRDGAHAVLGASAIVFRHRPPAPSEPASSLGILGNAPATRLLRQTIRVVGPTASTVLILGESGSGKELVARALHEASRRRGPLIAVNTSAIAATLAEAHLFGHVAGAFTGATTASAGLFRAADGGTLFLDEMADLASALQPKLLRVLEDRVVVPVGATKGTTVDTRVVCATNRDLLEEVDAGRFRGDLYARISDFTLRVAPLRERTEDVLALFARDLGDDAPPMSADLVSALLAHPWRFNVRELRKVAAQLRIRGQDAAQLTLDMIELDVSPAATASASDASRPEPSQRERPSSAPPRAEAAAVPTREALEEMLVRHRGVIELIARDTGRSRRQVHRWLEKYELDVERYREK